MGTKIEIDKILFRGGLPLNKDEIKANGISFTSDIKIVQYWASSKIGGKVYTYELLSDKNILKINEFPDEIVPKLPYDHQDKERIVNYALANNYDGVDLLIFGEYEIRIFNPNIVQLKTNINVSHPRINSWACSVRSETAFKPKGRKRQWVIREQKS